MVPLTSMDGCVSLGKEGRDLLAIFGKKPDFPMLANPFAEAWDEV